MIDIVAFMEEMEALRAPQKAIKHALGVIQRIEREVLAKVTDDQAKLAAIRLAQSDRQAARRERLRTRVSRDNHVIAGVTSRDCTRTVTGQSQDSHITPSTPSHSPTPRLNPHTPGAPTREEPGIVWPDLSEYPAVEAVERWAEAVLVPPECAAKWHAAQGAEGWASPSGRPLPTSENLLRAMFNSFASSWKAVAAREERREARANGQKLVGRNGTRPYTAEAAEAGRSAEELKTF